MFLLLKLAFRNALRNKRRTFLAGMAIGVGLAGLIFVDGLMIGMQNSMISSATDTFLGQGRITHKDFMDTLDIEKTIDDGMEILAGLDGETIIKEYAPRTMNTAMITSPANAEPILLVGVDPDREKNISVLKRAIRKGGYFQEKDKDKILIGAGLADSLMVEPGDLLVITAAKAKTGDLSQAMYRVGGVFSFGMREMDDSMAFIKIEEAQSLLGIGDGIHQIAINFTAMEIADDKSLPFWDQYKKENNLVQNWREVMPELAAVQEMTGFGIFLLAVILFGVVSLGILNTLFMSLYERMFEFGVLRAVGTRPVRMAIIILFEAGVLAVISIIIGVAIGYGVCVIVGHYGLNFVGIEYAGVTFMEPLRPVIALYQYIKYPAALFIFTLFVGLYPAIYAALLNPVEAMRRSL
jgi:ABC-type lipoprotein release transport system permease subunit